MALTSREFQYLCIGCFFVTPACAIITSSGTIEINTAVDITCINQPYTGTHIWKFNTAEVLICGPSNCMANASNPTRFSFVNDTGSGVFVFTINPVTRLDDESIIGCHDGIVEDTLKLEVQDSDGNQRKKNYGLIIGVPVTGFVVIIGVLILCFCPHIVRKLKKSEWEVRRLLGTKLITTLHLRPCHCRKYFLLQYRRKPFQRDNDSTWNSQKFKDNESQAELDLNADYEVKVCIKLFCIEFSRTDICTVLGGKLDPPKNFQFNENINNDGMPYVSWEPGFNGGCDQTFFEQFEKKFLIKTHNQTHKARDKPDPPTDFMFNENISSYELPYVSWVPGFDGGCPQTFFLQFETPNQTNTGRGKPTVYKENFHDQEITNTTAAEINKLKIDEGHAEILDVESNNIFAITSNNVTTTIRMQVKGLEPSSQYEIKLYGENKYGKSEVKTLHEKTHDKPNPPTDFMFNENISSFELPYVSWVPGFDGGCPQTFFLQFETPNQTNTGRGKPTVYKENFHDQEITNTTAAEINKLKIDEGHAEILDVESNNIFAITSNNVTTTIRMQVKGLEPLSQYEIKLYGENKYGKSEVKTLHEKTHGKPDPPKKFKFNENTNNDEMSYVSWEPGFNGGCEQTFILRLEKILIKTDNQIDTARGKPMSIKMIKFVEGHHEILDVKSNNTFAITSPKEAKEILLQIKGREPSSTYKIMLYSVNEYGESKVMTLYANETTILSHRSDHSDQQEQKMKVQLDGIVVEVADGSSLRPGHTNQPKHDKTLQRHGLSVEESNGSDPLQPPI